MAEIDSLEISITSSSTDAVNAVNKLANALEKLRTTATGGALTKAADDIKNFAKSLDSVSIKSDIGKTVSNISKSVEKLKDITGNDAMKQLSEQLKEFDSISSTLENSTAKFTTLSEAVKGFSDGIGRANISPKIADRLTQIGQAVDLITDDTVERLYAMSVALKQLSSVNLSKVNISPKLADRLLDIGTAMEMITPQAVSNLDAMADSLQRLSGINLSGLSGISSSIKSVASATKGGKSVKKVVDNITAKQDVNKATESAKEGSLSTEMADGAEGANAFAKALQIVKEKLESIAPITNKLSQGFKDFGSGISKQFEKATTSARGFQNAFSTKNDVFQIIEKQAGNLVSAIITKFPQAAAAVLALKVAYNTLIAPIVEATKKVIEFGKQLLKVGVDKFISGIKRLGGAIKSFSANVGKSFVSQFTKPFTNAFEAFSRWKAALGRIAFYRLVRSAVKAVTDGLREGIDNLYQYSLLVGTKFAPAMNSLATSALYLKNSLGAMASPLIEALAPAIDFIVDKFVALFNIINKVMSALTGKSSYTIAKKYAKDYAEAAGDAAKATDRFLLGIDELNIINEPSGGAADGLDYGSMFEEVDIDSDTMDWAAQIREAIENGDWRGAGELLADKLNDLVDSWDAYAWGTALGEKINNALNLVYGFMSRFDFETLGRKIAGAINGIFDSIDWDLLGRTFASGWNALIDFLYGLFDDLHWEDIGADIGTAINAWFDEIKWEKAAETVSKGIIGIIDLARSTIRTIQFDLIGKDISDFLNGIDWIGIFSKMGLLIRDAINAAITMVHEWILNFSFHDIFEGIAIGINNAILGLNLSMAADTINKLFIDLFNSIQDGLSKIQWRNIGVKIADFLSKIDWNGILMSLSNSIVEFVNGFIDLLGGFVNTMESNDKFVEIGTAVGNAIRNLFENIKWDDLFTNLSDFAVGLLNGISAALETMNLGEIIATLKSKFNTGIDWASIMDAVAEIAIAWFKIKFELWITKWQIKISYFWHIGVAIVKGMLEGIWKTIKNIGTWLKENLIDPVVDKVKELFGIASPSKVFEEIGGFLIEGLLEGIKNALANIGEWINTNIVQPIVNGVDTLKEELSKKWEEIKGAAVQKWEEIKSSLIEKWESIKESVRGKFEEIKEKIGEVWENIKTAAITKWEEIKSSLLEKWEAIKETVREKFEEIRDKLGEIWENIKESALGKWEEIKGYLLEKWEEIKSKALEKFNEIKDKVLEVWENIKKNAEEKWNSIKETIIGVFNGIKEGIKAPINAIIGFVESMVNGVINGINGAIGALNSFKVNIPDWIPGIGGKSFGFNLTKISTITIPKLADGGFPRQGQMFIAREAGPELVGNIGAKTAVANNDQIISGIASGVEEANTEVINALVAIGNQIIQAINDNGNRPIVMDGRKVSTETTSNQNRQNRMYGKTLQNT